MKKKKTLTREILEWVLTIVAAVVIALPVRAFGFELVRVDGESMDRMAVISLAGRRVQRKSAPHHNGRKSAAF